jgi:iron complex outermembrane receptor protein
MALCSILLIATTGTALAQATTSPQQSSEATSASSRAAAEQSTSPEKDSTGRDQLQEIVVTAEKRSETLLTAPVAVSALSMQTLETSGVVGVQDLNSIAPNTEIRTVGVDNGMLFSIRGVSDTEFNDAANPAVATYIDGIYVGRTEGLATMLYDLQRIEVLRGPQGTLYGRNSTGGNVNILTASPERVFDASADVSYGNYNDIQEHAMLNVPVTDTLAVRGVVARHSNDGYFDTVNTTLNNYGKADDYAVRLTSLWSPSDSFKWRLSIDDFVSHGTPSLDVITGPDGKPLNGGSPYKQPFVGIQEPYFFTEPNLYVNNLMLRSRVDWDMREGVTLSYIAGYQHVRDQPHSVLAFPLSGSITYAPFFRDTPAKANDQELDLNTDFGRLHNTTGANYYHQHFYSRGDADNLGGTLFLAHGDALIEAWGVFDQTTYDLTQALKVTGGIRYSHETDSEENNRFTFCPMDTYNPPNNSLQTLLAQQFTLPNCATVGGLSGGATGGAVSASHVDYRAGLEYAVSDRTSTYLTVTSGFKAGGLNLGPTIAPQDLTFKPEKATNYEFGLKTRLFDNRVGLNTAIFDTEYKEIQITQLSRDAIADITTNAGAARIYGVELEGEWQISAEDHLTASLNYLHATYTDYQNAIDQQFGTLYPSLKGYYLPFSPKFSGRTEYSHEIPLTNGGRLIGTAAVYWQTVNYLREFNLPVDKVPAYSKTDLTLQYVFPEGHFTVSGYVHNLEDKAVRNGSFPYLGGYLSSYNSPRTYGMRVSYKY